MNKNSIPKLITAILLITSFAIARDGATREEVVIKCHEAASMITSKGIDEAIKQISNVHGPFVWKDSYVFLMDLEGKMLAHPMQPELTKKKHVLLVTDPVGNAIFVHFVNLAASSNSGWVDYLWPRPGQTTPTKKTTYIYRIPGQNYFVGSGFYIDGMMY
ncbi:MAG: cache domain-containing protein [Fibrobacteres bacterium]|nr:cache domain-containing protein [Fibrobacterota bacterium]